MFKAMPYLKKVENEELKIKLQEFGYHFIKSGQKFVKKKQAKELAAIMKHVFDNSLHPEPIYKSISELLKIPKKLAKDHLLRYYLNLIESNQRRTVIPIAKKVAKRISQINTELIPRINIFKGEKRDLKKALAKIKQLEATKNIPELKSLKRKKPEDEEPEVDVKVLKILKKKLMTKILSLLDQNEDKSIEKEISRQLDRQLEFAHMITLLPVYKETDLLDSNIGPGKRKPIGPEGIEEAKEKTNDSNSDTLGNKMNPERDASKRKIKKLKEDDNKTKEEKLKEYPKSGSVFPDIEYYFTYKCRFNKSDFIIVC